jgi:hypothetical protein
MKAPIAIFYHARLSGGSNVDTGASVNPEFGKRLFKEQIKTVQDSGLFENCNEFYVGLNGTMLEGVWANEIVPRGTQLLMWLPPNESLLCTMRHLQAWLPGHEDWFVCFFHMKGATHPNDPLQNAWRACMTKHVITDWRKCVAALEVGRDAVGCHWLNGRRDDPKLPQPSFFGGVFWWATARFLLKLPPLPEKITRREDWYEPEWWIGSGPTPKICDYHPQWPSLDGCKRSAEA